MTTIFRRSRRKLVALLTLFTLAPLGASAALIGPAYPAPGGNSFSAGGAPSAGDAGGRIFSYSSFDNSAFSALYWGPNSGILPSAALDGTLDPMSLSSVSGTQAIWEGSTIWTNPTTLVVTGAATRLRITISGLGATPWVSFAGVNGTDPTGVGVVADNSAGVNYSATIEFLANTGSGWVPINTILQPPGGCGGPCTKTNFAGAFYSSPVPVPAAVWLLGSALGLLGVVRRTQTR